MAGIVGSKTYGAAKNITLIEVKALSGFGTGNLSAVIAGIEYATNDRQAHQDRRGIANLSLGANFNAVLNNAVNHAVDAGLPVVVAAGNTNSAACVTSPASAEKAITVGAIDDRYDSIASFSNWGRCVDVFASGVYVTSLSKVGNGTLAMSGTSMASPTVTGTLAMFMGLGATAADAMMKLTELATVGAIDRRSLFFRPTSPNLVVFNGIAPVSLQSTHDDQPRTPGHFRALWSSLWELTTLL